MAKLAPLLLAEDDSNDVLLFDCALKQSQLPNPLIVARDGQQAIDFLELLSSYRDRLLHPLPCMLLLDLKMPRLSGFDVLAWLERRPRLRSMPVVVFSSSPQAPDMLKARELGASDYRVKPSRLQDLVRMLNELRSSWIDRKPEVSPNIPPKLVTARASEDRSVVLAAG